MLACPRILETISNRAPFRRLWVAKKWRRAWGLNGFITHHPEEDRIQPLVRFDEQTSPPYGVLIGSVFLRPTYLIYSTYPKAGGRHAEQAVLVLQSFSSVYIVY